MTRKQDHTTRAGAGLPPAFAWIATLLMLAAAWPAHARTVSPSWPDSAGSEPRPATSGRDSVAPAPVVPREPAAMPSGTTLDSNRVAPASPSADSVGRAFEYLWVVRTALRTPAAVDSVVARAQARGVRGLLVQVVGRGDAFYRSDLLPRAESLPADDFDPLGRLVERGHAAGIEVHAWMNCMLVWSSPALPRDPRHVVRAHPEWVSRLRDGRRLTQLSQSQRRRLGLEGVFLAPAHPAVRTWLAQVAQEIVTRYPVDGLQLDYIRQPIVATGWDPTTRAHFALLTGVDPARFNRLNATERAHVDSAWMDFQGKQVQAAVEEVRDSVRRVRPTLSLSAAVIADTLTADRNNAQRWRDWLRLGLLDRVFVMCYAQPVQTVLDQLVGYRGTLGDDPRVVPGIAVYNTPPSAAAAKIRGARALGFPTLAVYSYDSLAEQPGYWGRLLNFLAGDR